MIYYLASTVFVLAVVMYITLIEGDDLTNSKPTDALMIVGALLLPVLNVLLLFATVINAVVRARNDDTLK